jgi:hypothetical protein
MEKGCIFQTIKARMLQMALKIVTDRKKNNVLRLEAKFISLNLIETY